jgi:hypothetical protein
MVIRAVSGQIESFDGVAAALSRRSSENQKQVMPAGVAWAQIRVFVVVTACTSP